MEPILGTKYKTTYAKISEKLGHWGPISQSSSTTPNPLKQV